MSISFERSNTKLNLMKAFAGESQARNRYTFAASQAKKENLAVIQKVFEFTANQEKEHAKIFYGFLSSCRGQNINIEGGYPVDIYNSVVDLLKCAEHNEFEEYKDVYKSFSKEAASEGFKEISETFSAISEIEKVHGERFHELRTLIQTNRLFVSSSEEAWFCLNCGHIHIGNSAPKECSVCKHNQGYFIRRNWLQI